MIPSAQPASALFFRTFCAAAALLFVACQGEAEAPAPRRGRSGAFPVETAKIEARRVDYALRSVGTLLPFDEVQVTARVSGVVEKIRFLEGTRVEPGTLLAEIEPERARIAVASARAAADKARAASVEAKLSFQRREQLFKKSPGLISAEEVELYRTRWRTAQADEALAQAALALAELNLRDAFVRAPVGGVIEARSVQTGHYVQPGAAIARIVQRDPLLVETEVSTDEAAQLTAGMTLFFSTGSADDVEASLLHVGQAANRRSRRVRVVARVERDADAGSLRPGDFAKVRIPIGGRDAAPVVPQVALRPSERGFLAYVVQDGRARERVVSLGLRTEDGLVEIRDGLSAGEELVVRGSEPLYEGASVRVTPDVDATPPAPRVDDAPGGPKSGQAS